MPILRLRKHPANFSEEDILINPSDYVDLKLFDVVELKPPKGGNAQNRILLQVRKWPDATTYPNYVSIKDTIVNTHLKLYADVLVNIVQKRDVVVDSIEICFSSAYLARSYMWGLRNHLNNRCVYQRQKLQYLNIRSQICEIWSQGSKVSSGYVDDDTKIVFRSASSLVYLFIQMSSEMWDYDINGDLYCEKAINGFLTDLFETWRRNECSHDITIVLFSRTFYDAESIEEFPKEMRECLQVDYKNRFYEDCYRVAFQNDRFDLHDWNAKLTTLKSLFNQYQKEVIDRHQDKYGMKIPRAYNSSASQGNFLEVLNISLNVFEKHYFDRSFDRTGQLSVVVSPGVGVFEVDFEMTNLTKQRIIDNGIGSDLVCLGEQPLHTVPLLKFNSKSSQLNDNLATCDVYNMPHWINLSFYSSLNQVYYSNFVPRIKLPTIHNKFLGSESTRLLANSDNQPLGRNQSHQQSSGHYRTEPNVNSSLIANVANTITSYTNNHKSSDENNKERPNCQHQQRPYFSSHPTMPDLVDYDDYDSQVFKPNSMITYHNQQPSARGDRSVLSDLDSNVDCLADDQDRDDDITDEDDFLGRDHCNKSANVQRRSSDVKNYQEYSRNMKRQQLSDNLPICQTRVSPEMQSIFTRMSLVDSYMSDIKIKPESADDLSVRGYNVQSSRINRSSARPKALINPFDPSHMTIKLTPNRRRWTHVFPQGPTGTFIQQHHYQPVPQKSVGLSSSGTSPYLADVSHPIPEHEAQHLLRNNMVTCDSIRCEKINISITGKQGTDGASATVATLSSGPSFRSTSSNGLMVSGSSSSLGGHKSTLVSNDTIRFAWCASGEQEWTPAITTGVDWKSLTMPACLPLTTDFFPSKTSLQNDYVIGEYTIDSSCIHPRYTLIEVYRELVCQRLQKGFQIILLPRQSSSNSEANSSCSAGVPSGRIVTSPSSRSTQPSPSSPMHKSSNSSSRHHRSSRNHSKSSIETSNINGETDRERTEYTMSIGRIFHKLSLSGNTITVSQYRPRHPYPTIKIDYCYRFRAPFHETYGQSWVHFKSEKLEEYSWNYLDNYICARGEHCELRSSLKFWRFRVLVLPSRLSLRKISHSSASDGCATKESAGCANSSSKQQSSRHDVHYLDYSDEERVALMESFIKLLEIIKKTRRASACRMSSSSYSSTQSTSSSASNTNQANRATSSSQASLHSRLSVQISSSTSSSDDDPLVGQASSLVAADRTSELRFESINMDIESALRDARRAEWVHVQYHSFYDVELAFELVIKWMVASGAGIAEMVQGWSRKAGNSSVHIVPIPWEPFALPHSGKADPLRCPIGIQLHIDCLPDGSSTDDNQLIGLQERILRRFGFIRFHDLISTENIERQYVHLSGFAFVALANLVSSETDSTLTEKREQDQQHPMLVSRQSPPKFAISQQTRGSATAASRVRAKGLPTLRLEHQETISSPHEEYITRHISGARQNKASWLSGDCERIEFIWSWNYMLTKRWRSLSTQDESYAVELMQDFRDFCQNGDGRLVEFWSEIKSSS